MTTNPPTITLPTKLHKICATKPGRFLGMLAVQYRPDGCGPIQGPALIASDRHMAAIVSAPSEPGEAPGEACGLPIEACAAAWKAAVKGKQACIVLNGKARVPWAPGQPEFPYAEGELPPSIGSLFPASTPTVTVKLNVAHLALLAEALGSDCVEIELRVGTGPVLIRPIPNSNAMGEEARTDRIGIIMPIGGGCEPGKP